MKGTKPEKVVSDDDVEALKAKNAELASRLDEAEETIRAIQQGAVDAFVLEELGRRRVYSLEGAERPYRLFVEEMQQGVATLHKDGTIAYGNRRLAQLLQVPHDELIGANLRDFIAPDDRGIADELLAEGRSGTAGGEVRLKRGDGSCLAAHLTLNTLPNEPDALMGLFVTDVTVQKNHDQLARAQDALRDADRRKNEFLAMLSHELRNPLAPIRNAVNILRLTGGDPDSVRSMCAMLDRQVGQMVRLVDDLLDISRITRNKIELRRERIALAPILDQAVECVRPLVSSMEHELAVTLPSSSVYLDADAVRLTQVFANLLDNACKYMERGGRVTIRVELSSAHDGVVVRIRDEGMGIPADQLTRIFDMFAQIDTSLERSKSGLGIGLTLVTSLVELHGGRVEVHSDGCGKGSEFSVHLPVMDAPSTLRAPQREEAAGATTRNRILVVDDNRDSAESLAQLLKLLGHETAIALDGLEAIEAAEALRPDVVLLDIGLPKLNGYDACRQIRKQPWAKGMLLIAQTGWGQNEDRQKTEEAGFDGHLVKPVEPEVLLKLLASKRP